VKPNLRLGPHQNIYLPPHLLGLVHFQCLALICTLCSGSYRMEDQVPLWQTCLWRTLTPPCAEIVRSSRWTSEKIEQTFFSLLEHRNGSSCGPPEPAVAGGTAEGVHRGQAYAPSIFCFLYGSDFFYRIDFIEYLVELSFHLLKAHPPIIQVKNCYSLPHLTSNETYPC
jgi:hypothetical protein